jgi:hypothetical protein
MAHFLKGGDSSLWEMETQSDFDVHIHSLRDS